MPQLAQTTTPELIAPEGGTLYRLTTTLTRYSTWEAAIRAGAPDTPRSNSVRRAGRFFEPPGTYDGSVNLVMLWMGKESMTSTRRANAWALENSLLESSPYDVFGLSAIYPYLYEEYGLSGAGFVATQTCDLPKPHVCGVWQSKRGERRASLVETGFQFYDRTIFVYREP